MDHGAERRMTMVPVSNFLAVAFTSSVSLFLPLLLLLMMAVKWKKQGMVSAWILGAAGFLVTQIAIRRPVLSVLSGQSWFFRFSQEHLFGYTFALAFTAGLFELAGRYAVAKIMTKRLTCRRSLAAGLGHGGIEAIVIVGMAYINNIAYILMIQSGSFDAMLAQVPMEQAAYLESIRRSLVGGSPWLYLLAGYERILTIICHTAMSMMVCWGVSSGKTGKYLLACLVLHTFIDLTAGISLLVGTVLSQMAAFTIIYIILTAVAAVSLLLICRICRRWQKSEVTHA